MQSDDQPKGVRDTAAPFRSQPGKDEVPGMPGWTIEALNREIEIGLASGPAVPFDFDAYLARKHRQWARRAKSE